MGTRLELHELLCDILGSRNVYYQPPETVKIRYPAIIYNRRSPRVNHADNSVYKITRAYEITVIDYEPDSEIAEQISELPLCSFDRVFVSDNLNHTNFTIYY